MWPTIKAEQVQQPVLQRAGPPILSTNTLRVVVVAQIVRILQDPPNALEWSSFLVAAEHQFAAAW